MTVSNHLADTIYATICANNADAAELIALLNGSATGLALILALGSIAPNVYTVDTTAVAADAAVRRYATADAAVAAIEANAGLTKAVILVREGQTHAAWTGAGVSGTKSFTFTCLGDRTATLPITLGGTLTAPTGTQYVTFDRIAIQFGADFNTTGWLLGFQNSVADSIIAANAACQITALSTTVENCDFTDVLIRGSDALVTCTCRRSDFGYTVAAAVQGFSAGTGFSVLTFVDCSFRVTNTTAFNFTLFGRVGGPETPVLAVRGGYARLDASGAGAIAVVSAGYSIADVSGTEMCRIAGGTVNWGKAGTNGQFNWHGTVPDDANLPTGAWYNNAGTISQA